MHAPSPKGRAAAWMVPVINELFALVRSIVFARLLGPDELGKIMLLALALRLVEMASDFSIERLLAQAPEGDSARFQSNLQGAAVLRGVVLSLILVGLALPLSSMFSDGPEAVTFALLALVPLLRGLVHLDYRRLERNFNYRGLVVVDGGAALAMLISAPIFATLIGDNRALLPVILIQFGAQLILSHILAERRYSLLFDRKELSRIWMFGAPLIFNAFLMFLTFQADRLIVAGYYSWAELGVYGVALQLALLPAQIAGRAAGSLLAPAFRRAISIGDIATVSAPALKTYLLLAVFFLLGFGLLSKQTIVLVYGAEFSVGLPLVWALGLSAAIRIGRTPISQLAVSLGKTSIPAKGNILRGLTIVPALLAAMLGAPLYALAIASALGEALAAARSWFLLKPFLAPSESPVNFEVIA